MVVADDDVEPAIPGEPRRLDRGDALIYRHQDPDPRGGRLLHDLGRQAIAVLQPVRYGVRDVGPRPSEPSHQQGHAGHSIHIVVTTDEDGFLTRHRPLESGDRYRHSRHRPRVVERGSGRIQEDLGGLARGAASTDQEMGKEGRNTKGQRQGGRRIRIVIRDPPAFPNLRLSHGGASSASTAGASRGLGADAPLVNQRGGNKPGGVGADQDPNQQGEGKVVDHLSA